jgi:cell division protein ZipA
VPPVEVVADDLEDFEEEDEFVVEPEPAAPTAAEFDSTAFAQVEPIVEWPPESERTLISVRLAASGTERFAGRLVRMALAAEGFARGKYDIFHKPDDHNRAVLSAASLTKPGTFDLETIDSQRFTGLSLFAILPGPKAPVKTFEELLLTARSLNERLQGQLQDDRGGPLTPTRVALLRDEVEALER